MTTTVIWEYELAIEDTFKLDIPEDGEILHFGNQRERPCIWVRVDPEMPTSERKFKFIGTGHSIDDTKNLNYIGTEQFNGGYLVLHLFEVIE